MSDRLDTRARRLVTLKDRMNETKITFEAAERAYRDEEKDFWQALKDELGNVKKFSADLGPGFGNIELQRRETITSRILDVDEAAAALEEMGMGDIVGKSIPKKPLNDLVRERTKSGQPLPDGVDSHVRRYIAVSRKD